MTNFNGTSNSIEVYINSLPESKEIAGCAIDFFNEHNGNEQLIDFQNADPGFAPFVPAIATISNGLSMRPELLRHYLTSNAAYNPEILIQYVEHLGILPPENKARLTGKNITTGLGATSLYTLAVESLVKEGDVHLITAPTYGLFSFHPLFQKADVETVQLEEKSDWKLNPESLDKRIGEIEQSGRKVKTFLHMNPHNPLGTIEDAQDVKALADVLRDRGIIVIDDLVYSGIEYDGMRAVPLASMEGMADSTLTLFSLSKAYGAPGLRSAMAIGSENIIRALCNSMMCRMESPPITSQLGLIGTFNMMPDIAEMRKRYLSDNANEYKRRRDLVHALVNGYDNITIEGLKHSIISLIDNYASSVAGFDREAAYQLLVRGVPGVRTLNVPNAGYFQLLDFSEYNGKIYHGKKIETSLDVVKVLAREGGLLVLTGEFMQYEGRELVGRITYAAEPDVLLKGLMWMSRAVGEIKEN